MFGKKRKMVGKKNGLFILGLVVVVLFAWFVIAGISVNTGSHLVVRAPTTGSNFSSGNNTGNLGTLFNVSFKNGTFGSVVGDTNGSTGLFNATFWINISAAQWVVVGNSTQCLTHEAGTFFNNMSCWSVLNASSLYNGTLVSDGYYTLNATIWNGSAFISPTKASNMTTILIDNNVNVNKTNVNAGTNHSTRSNSGNLTLNVSIPDVAVSSIDTVLLGIINSTGHANETLIATREGASSYWSTSVNTSHFNDGNYTIVVGANDTLGNFNSTANGTTTAQARTLFFDNTVPTVTFSCTPTTVDAGSTVTCSCSGSATSGISSKSFTINPSTSSTGQFTETCSVTSRSGLSASATATYTVNQGGAGGGGGSGGGSVQQSPPEVTWTTTVEEDDAELSSKGSVSASLGGSERASVLVSGETHTVGVVSVTSNSAVVRVESTPREVTLAVGQSEKFELTDDNFYDMLVTLNSVVNSEADLSIEYINEEIPQAAEPSEPEAAGEAPPSESRSSSGTVIAVVLILLIIAVVVFFVWKRNQA